jgi:hypothetical protein
VARLNTATRWEPYSDTTTTSALAHTPCGPAAVEVEARRQHLHAVVAPVSDEHEAVGRDAANARVVEAQRGRAAALAPVLLSPPAVSDAVHLQRVGAAVAVRHQQRRAVASDGYAVRQPAVRVDDSRVDASQAAAEEASDGAGVHAAERPRHALATAQHGDATILVAQHRRHAHGGCAA